MNVKGFTSKSFKSIRVLIVKIVKKFAHLSFLPGHLLYLGAYLIFRKLENIIIFYMKFYGGTS